MTINVHHTHIATARQGLWSPYCIEDVGWVAPLVDADYPAQATCPQCREKVGLLALPDPNVGEWTLEYRGAPTGRESRVGKWMVWTRGALEECLADLMDLRIGRDGLGNSYDAARITYVRPS